MGFQNVAIVGGGPIGLYSAIVLRHKYPSAKITIFEKRENYSREHRVRIDNLKLLNPELTLNGLMSIKCLERVLKSRLQSINVVLTEIANLWQIRQHLPNVTSVIFADGAHSKARFLYFGGEKTRITYAHGCNIRYSRTSTNVDYLSLEHNYRLSKLLSSHVVESVRDTSVHLTLISRQPVSEEAWKQKMHIAINVRRVELAETVLVPPTISMYQLQLYTASKFHVQENGIDLYLVGDAAIGLPYECGLAAGFKSVRALLQSPDTYPQRVKEIQDSFLTKIESRNVLLSMYLGYCDFWKGTIFEWQRWTRAYESLLLSTTSIFDDSFLTNEATINRNLVLHSIF